MIDTRKTTQEILQEEILRERAAVLARAGERLEAALADLGRLAGQIDAALAARHSGKTDRDGVGTAPAREGEALPNARINGMIRAYNDQLESVRMRYYDLVVTREALGLIHHQRLEEIYRIPPKRRCLPEKRATAP
jgi:hypothetical protein